MKIIMKEEVMNGELVTEKLCDICSKCRHNIQQKNIKIGLKKGFYIANSDQITTQTIKDCKRGGDRKWHPLFIWTSNITDHHGENITPHTPKSGGGLGVVAKQCHNENIPTLGLPTCKKSGGIDMASKKEEKEAVKH